MFLPSIVDCFGVSKTLFDQPCECRDGVILLHRHRATNGHNEHVLAIRKLPNDHASATTLHFCRTLMSSVGLSCEQKNVFNPVNEWQKLGGGKRSANVRVWVRLRGGGAGRQLATKPGRSRPYL
jgi:hypothetical protein